MDLTGLGIGKEEGEKKYTYVLHGFGPEYFCGFTGTEFVCLLVCLLACPFLWLFFLCAVDVL